MSDFDYKTVFLNEIKNRFGIIGNSPKMLTALEKLIQAAPTELNVLITGETGTGKEVFAKAIHGLSNRKNNPFVSVNCGAIPENLLESELFGNEKGAFTGAVEQRIGFFETANKGTIFLDEIGEMPVSTQVKLLRVLESGEYSRLGSSAVRKVDARLVAATNRDLEKEVRRGNFRQDLFFRLKSVHIILPPLREHPADIPFLIDFFAEKVCKKLNLVYHGFENDSLSILKSLPWPGNTRELKNLIETIITLEKGELISPEILRKYIPPALPAFEMKQTAPEYSIMNINRPETSDNELTLIFKTLLELKSDISSIKSALGQIMLSIDKVRHNTDNFSIQQFEEVSDNDNVVYEEDNNQTLNISEIEKEKIVIALKKFSGNRRKASEALGISLRTLYRKMSEYGIEKQFYPK